MQSAETNRPPESKASAISGLHHEIHTSDAVCHRITCFSANALLHWHDNIEIAFPLEHSCSFLVDGTLYDAGPGDMIVTGPRVTHQFRPSANYARFMVFQLSPRSLQALHVSPHSAKVFIPRREIEADPELCRRVDTLFEWLSSPTDHADPAGQSLCVHLYCLLAQHFPSTDADTTDRSELEEFHTVFRFVNEHFREDITVSSIAKSLYFTRNKLPVLFLKYAGISLADYIRELRIDNARQLLTSGCSMTHAAMESGFQNVRTFNNTFRRTMGMSPTEYLQSQKQSPAESGKND